MKEILQSLFENPIIYLILSLLLVFSSKSALSHLNVFDIVKSYFKDIIFKYELIRSFIFAPILMGIAITIVTEDSKSVVEFMGTAISILISMFFAYIAFYDDHDCSTNTSASENITITAVINESQEIASYEILLSVILLSMCMIEPVISVPFLQSIYLVILYSLFINLILNLLVLLKKYSKLKKTQANNHNAARK